MITETPDLPATLQPSRMATVSPSQVRLYQDPLFHLAGSPPASAAIVTSQVIAGINDICPPCPLALLIQ